MRQSVLDQLKPGEVRLICGAAANDIIDCLEQGELDEATVNRRMVTCFWEELPSAGAILDQIIEALAQSALALWPCWYGQSRLARDDISEIGQSADLPPEVMRPWYELASAHCRNRQPPQPAGFANAIQAGQLVRAIQADSLCIFLGTSVPAQASDRLLGLARAAEWLADQTGASVGVVISPDQLGVSELESINYQTLDLAFAFGVKHKADGEWPEVTIWPSPGRAHPFSPGEQRLAQRLREDVELGPLFAFNQEVRTVRGTCHIVDLLWSKGRLVVEIDGITYHSRRRDFHKDRQRDYELLITDFVVLRIPHDEIMADVEQAINKIRDVVLFRRRILNV